MLLPGRIVSLSFGLLTIILVYKMGKRLYGAKAGVAAALALTLSRSHIWASGMCLADVCTAFFATLVVWFALNIAEKGHFRDYVMGGCAIGLTASAKYNGALVATAIAVGHLCYLRRQGFLTNVKKWVNGGLVGASVAALGAFLITSPGWIFQFREFVDGLLYQMQVVSQGHIAIGRFGGKLQMAKLYWHHEGTISLLGGLGFLWAAWRHRFSDVVIMGVVSSAFLVIGRWYNNMSLHYLLFIFPVLSVLMGGFLFEVSGKILPKRSIIAYWILLLITLAQPFWVNIQAAYAERLIDNRRLAQGWIQKNIPAGEKIALDWLYTPPVSTKEEQEEALRKHPEWKGVFDRIPTYQQVELRKSVDWLVYTDATWLVTSNWDYDRFFLGAAPPEGNPLRHKYFEYRSFYERLREEKSGKNSWALIKSLNQGKGPIVEIYKKGKSSKE
jgi:4-amino-4-deoxy-L-arabinose transferase-like glycosyltransferase